MSETLSNVGVQERYGVRDTLSIYKILRWLKVWTARSKIFGGAYETNVAIDAAADAMAGDVLARAEFDRNIAIGEAMTP